MKRLLAGLLLLGAAASCSGGESGASLRFATGRLELGTMHQYEERQFVLPFTIEGSGKVRVDVLDTSCGCTDVRLVVNGEVLLQAEKGHGASATTTTTAPPPPQAEQEDKGVSVAAGDKLIELPAGTSGEVIGTYKPAQRTGNQIVTVTIAGSMLNSPAKSQIHALVKPVFVIAKDAGNFGTLRESVLRAGQVAREFEVRAPGPFQVKFWKNVPETLRIEALPGPAQGSAEGGEVVQRFRLSLLPTAAAGTIQFVISGETTLSPAPLEVHVAWRLLGPVVYAPEHRVQFQNKTNDQDHEVLVRIRPSSPEEAVPEPKAEFLGETAGVLVATVEPLAASGTEPAGWTVRVRLPKGTPAGVYNGTLRISYPAAPGIAVKEMTAYARVQEPR